MNCDTVRQIRLGGCHCGKIRFKVSVPDIVKVIICNCSICSIKQLHHFIIEEKDFHLLQGAENLTLYTFNTGQAKHYFCKTCGVESFYKPRSNPEGIGIVYSCMDPGTLNCEKQTFNGIQWEESMEKINKDNLIS